MILAIEIVCTSDVSGRQKSGSGRVRVLKFFSGSGQVGFGFFFSGSGRVLIFFFGFRSGLVLGFKNAIFGVKIAKFSLYTL